MASDLSIYLSIYLSLSLFPSPLPLPLHLSPLLFILSIFCIYLFFGYIHPHLFWLHTSMFLFYMFSCTSIYLALFWQTLLFLRPAQTWNVNSIWALCWPKRLCWSVCCCGDVTPVLGAAQARASFLPAETWNVNSIWALCWQKWLRSNFRTEFLALLVFGHCTFTWICIRYWSGLSSGFSSYWWNDRFDSLSLSVSIYLSYLSLSLNSSTSL